jgi:hypothetical protein
MSRELKSTGCEFVRFCTGSWANVDLEQDMTVGSFVPKMSGKCGHR